MSKTRACSILARRITGPAVRVSNMALRYYRDKVYRLYVWGGEN